MLRTQVSLLPLAWKRGAPKRLYGAVRDAVLGFILNSPYRAALCDDSTDTKSA